MNLIPSFLRRTPKPVPVQATNEVARRWQAAITNRLNRDWPISYMSPDYEVYTDGFRLRRLAHSLAQNNPFVMRYLELLQTNVVGPNGMQFQARILDAQGKPAAQVNDTLTDAWEKWGHAASVDGQFTFADLEHQVIKSVAEGGEILVRLIRNPTLNEFGFCLQLIEAELLDWKYNRGPSPSQNAIIQGIEVDKFGRPVAYHCWTQHPESAQYGYKIERVVYDARDIIHLFRPDRPGQHRGVPWYAGVIPTIAFLDTYMQSELVGSAASAQVYAVIERDAKVDVPQAYTPVAPTQKVEEHALELEMATVVDPGAGKKLVPWSAARPNPQFEAFVKQVLHQIASGLGVSYSTLSSDMSQDNYSSARMSALIERDHFRRIQTWLIRSFHMEVYRCWLETAILTDALKLPTTNAADYHNVLFRARSWKYSDPTKEAKAYEEMIKAGLISKTQVAAEQGFDYNEIAVDRANEERTEREIEKDLQAEGLLPVTVQRINAITGQGKLPTDEGEVG